MLIPFFLGLAAGAAVLTPKKWSKLAGGRRVLIYEHRPGEPNLFFWVVLDADAKVVSYGVEESLAAAEQAATANAVGRS
ncbi:MAG: hypothetical protein K0U78_16350 [Actinomycetia bacterium]|nr:hypothetical protein [Actinomycetes bacterium]